MPDDATVPSLDEGLAELLAAGERDKATQPEENPQIGEMVAAGNLKPYIGYMSVEPIAGLEVEMPLRDDEGLGEMAEQIKEQFRDQFGRAGEQQVDGILEQLRDSVGKARKFIGAVVIEIGPVPGGMGEPVHETIEEGDTVFVPASAGWVFGKLRFMQVDKPICICKAHNEG